MLLIFILSCGTDQGPGLKFKYTVLNQTVYDITAKGYTNNDNSTPVIIKIESGKSLTKTFQQSLPAAELFRFANFFGTKNNPIDSLVIIYADQRFQTFMTVCGDNNKNPLDVCFYNDREEEFIFDSASYTAASNCDSGCL